MFNQLDSFSSFSSRPNSPLFVIVLFVIASHLVLLGIGVFWEPASSIPKPRSKVLVQTVRLQPIQSDSIQHSASLPAALPITAPLLTANLPIEQLKAEPPMSPKEEVLPSQPDVTLQKEEAPPIQEAAVQKEPIVNAIPEAAPPPTPPLPIKTENKPQPKALSPKPAPQETPKKNTKQIAPIKKSIEPAKKTVKNEAVKSKQAEEAEKKRQQEMAEAERKRQQEMAAVQEVARRKEQALLAKAKETLAKMGETRDKISSSSLVSLESTSLPKALGSLHVDALPLGTENTGEWGTKEVSYSEEVAYRLKMTLRLPDYGAVKIKLTLDRTGKVIKVETVQSESSKNKTYVESKIPTLLFPSFGQRFQGVSQNTFVITLQNDS